MWTSFYAINPDPLEIRIVLFWFWPSKMKCYGVMGRYRQWTSRKACALKEMMRYVNRKSISVIPIYKKFWLTVTTSMMPRPGSIDLWQSLTNWSEPYNDLQPRHKGSMVMRQTQDRISKAFDFCHGGVQQGSSFERLQCVRAFQASPSLCVLDLAADTCMSLSLCSLSALREPISRDSFLL